MEIRPLVLPEKKLLLLTNGKCGGTSLHRWFFSLLDEPFERRRFRDLERNFSLRFALTVFGLKATRMRAFNLEVDDNLRKFVEIYRRAMCQDWEAKIKKDDYLKILVVRNPVQRLLSAYLDKFCGSDRISDYVVEVTRQGGLNGQISFRQFVSYLETVPNDDCNGHWRRQTFVLERVQYPVSLIRLEYFIDDMSTLQSLGHIPKLPRKNSRMKNAGRYSSSTPPADIMNLTLADLIKRGKCLPRESDFLEPELIDRIKRVYSKDYDRLPYV